MPTLPAAAVSAGPAPGLEAEAAPPNAFAGCADVSLGVASCGDVALSPVPGALWSVLGGVVDLSGDVDGLGVVLGGFSLSVVFDGVGGVALLGGIHGLGGAYQGFGDIYGFGG
jgi:hypothetical protein